MQYKQIKNLKNESNFLIFADDNDFDEIKELKKKTNLNVFKLFNKDLNYFASNKIEIKKFFNGIDEIFEDISTKIDKKVIDINVGNETFEKIDQCFENINSNLYSQEEATKEDIKIMLIPINNLRFRLRDHIFGFPRELSDEIKTILSDYSSELRSRKNQFNEKIYDNLARIISLFNSLPEDGLNIFDERLKNFHEILKINDPKDTIIYAYNLERKRYYEDNIKEKFNLSDDQLGKIIQEVGIQPSDFLEENSQWFMLEDGTISPGIYRVKNAKICNRTLDEIILPKDQVKVFDGSPIGDVFGINVYEATHVKTNQRLYITISEIYK